MGLAAVLSLSRTPQETRELAARKPPQEGEGEEDVNAFARRKPMPATKPAAPLKPQVHSHSAEEEEEQEFNAYAFWRAPLPAPDPPAAAAATAAVPEQATAAVTE